MPQLLNRETTPLFIIDNHDAKTHEVHLEIYHGENELVFNQTYEITSYETFRYEERLSFFREYSFKVILNEEFEKTYEMRETFSNSLVIQLYKDEIPLNLDVI